ncbi:MAG: alpha/beta hydrolase [Rhizobiales bacterium]|nr:alpha/beta hydrolase [Hyphomicrobiales bacterium]
MSGYTHIRHSGSDGAALYARHYAGGGLTPLLCLPGLTLNSKSFEPLMPYVSGPRAIIAPDFRGRGLSAYTDPNTYRPGFELADTIALMDHLRIEKAAVLGTSRGGIVGMVMAAQNRDRIAGLLLNDVGPKLEAAGLLRIRSYLGRPAEFPSWEAAAAALMAVNPDQEGLTFDDWMAMARRIFRDANGLPKEDYDLRLSQGFPSEEDIAAGRVAEIWDVFKAGAGLPLSVLRGGNSDLLSGATVARMGEMVPDLDSTVIPGRGHVPLLDEPQSLAAIKRWLDRVDVVSGAAGT